MDTSLKTNERRLLFTALGISLFVIGIVYSFGLSGSFHFDDWATLAPLAEVVAGGRAIEYILGGHTGPLGRPVALATFLLQKEAWPETPSAFLLANIVIHLANGLLAAILCFELARATNPSALNNIWKGVIAGILWVLLPINATAVLTVVQRMTLLATMFTLAGLIAFVHGRRLAAIKPRKGLLWMTAAVVICTPLAAFSKENGLLLPLYALTLHLTVLSGLSAPPAYRAWSSAFLKAPTFAIFGYLAVQLFNITEAYQFRNFDFYDRITTQGYALLDYLRILALPRPLDVSPFYDDYAILGSYTPAFVGPIILLSWGLVILWAISNRKRHALGALAVLWFLGGHVIESTTLPLELFFLHRNYLPSLGIVISGTLSICTWRPVVESPKLSIALGAALLISFCGSLLSTTTMWGAPRVAAELWVLERPSSIRATENLSTYYRNEGDNATADKLLRAAFSQNPRDAGMAIDRLHTYCDVADRAAFAGVLAETAIPLKAGFISNQTTQKLDTIVAAMKGGRCNNLNDSDAYKLLEFLEENPQIKKSSLNQHNLLLIRFRLQISERLFSDAMSSLVTAYEIMPNFDTLRLISETLTAGGLQKEAVEFVTNSSPPKNASYYQKLLWQRKASDLLRVLNASGNGEMGSDPI